MTDKPLCPKCGAELSADAAQGLCPKCLLDAGLESQAASAAGRSADGTVHHAESGGGPDDPSVVPVPDSLSGDAGPAVPAAR